MSDREVSGSRSPYRRLAETRGGSDSLSTITVLWIIGSGLSAFGVIVTMLSDHRRGDTGVDLGFATLVSAVGGVVLLVAIIATGVRLGREASR